ncbi:MAG: tetratricopeptide repeat protein [Candidatus Aegiribacteria sp.]|nr:tetratricopeptide repeat protein [Candidatus Aegiribacteria sp.]
MPNKEILALDKELEGLRLLPPGSELVIALNRIAHACLHSDPRKAETCALEVKDLAEKLGLPLEQARSYRTLGIIACDEGKFAEAMSHCRKSMEIYEKLGDKKNMASIHGTMAVTYSTQGMIDRALEHYHESLRQKQEFGASEDELAISHLNIGACYSSLHRLDLAQSSYAFVLKIWEKSGDRTKLSYLYHNIGCLYGEKEELEKAREYFQKALDIREDLGNKTGIASTLGNLGLLHEKLDDNESALDYFIRSLELYEEIGKRRETAYICGCVGGAYTSLGCLDEAEELINRGLEITRELEVKDVEIHCLEKITDLYEAKENLQKALQHSRELKTCLEEHLNEKSMEKIAKLQVQFETEKKEKEAEIYRLKNVELSSMNDQLRDALADVKRLQGLLPICANCKKIRNDDGYWQQIELYVSDHSDAKFSHGLCPECMIKLYGKDFTQEQ